MAGLTASYHDRRYVMFVFHQSRPGLWICGHYDRSGAFVPESAHNTWEDAADRCILLNITHPACSHDWHRHGTHTDPWGTTWEDYGCQSCGASRRDSL